MTLCIHILCLLMCQCRRFFVGPGKLAVRKNTFVSSILKHSQSASRVRHNIVFSVVFIHVFVHTALHTGAREVGMIAEGNGWCVDYSIGRTMREAVTHPPSAVVRAVHRE